MKTSNDFNLYQISNALAALDERLEAEVISKTGEISELGDDDAELLGLIAADKIDSCVGYYQSMTDRAAALKERAKAFAEAAKIAEAKAERFKNYIEMCLKIAGKEEIAGKHSMIKFRKNPASCEIVDQDKIPPKYVEIIQEIKISKKQILDDLKKGVAVAGARLVDDKKSLTFKNA
jgi:hypothetical protein